MEEANLFRASARALWARGEDGEVIARDLANALKWVIEEGVGKDRDLCEEFKRLLQA